SRCPPRAPCARRWPSASRGGPSAPLCASRAVRSRPSRPPTSTSAASPPMHRTGWSSSPSEISGRNILIYHTVGAGRCAFSAPSSPTPLPMRTLLLSLTLLVSTGALAQGGERLAPLLDGLGTHTRAVAAEDPMAQRFFDQGLVLAFAFNHAEAARAFREAQRLDPACAMCAWGEALVLGPHVNAPMNPDDVPAAWDALERARALAASESDVHRALIDALGARYGPEPVEDRSALDRAYADAMRAVAARFPDDADVQSLFAEAL